MFNSTTIERFWQRVSISDSSSCWLWTKANGEVETGKGVFYFQSTWKRPSQVAYILAHGPIPEGKYVCHSCDNPPCCNPDHLWAGTHQENMDDMTRKGRDRHNCGEDLSHSKLCEQDVLKIRQLYATGRYSHLSLSQIFQVCEASIRNVIILKTWKHI